MIPADSARFPALPVTMKNGATGIIRPLAVTDGEALAAFYEAIPLESKRFYFPHLLDREHALGNAAKAESPLEVVLVLEAPGGALVGYAWYRWERADADRSHFGICLLPPYQSIGAGGLLMARLWEIAREVGPSIMALTVQLANPRAVALYQKMGFTVIREQMVTHHPSVPYPPEPEYYMERQVR